MSARQADLILYRGIWGVSSLGPFRYVVLPNALSQSQLLYLIGSIIKRANIEMALIRPILDVMRRGHRQVRNDSEMLDFPSFSFFMWF
jgi:hypothetical protein